MRREPRLYVLHESSRELCRLEPILGRAVMERASPSPKRGHSAGRRRLLA